MLNAMNHLFRWKEWSGKVELIKKMLRDIVKNKGQFLTIIFMATLGVLVFSGLDSVRLGLIQSSNRYYKSVNLANMWVSADNVNSKELNKIKSINGVSNAQSRLTYIDMDGKKQIKLIASEKNDISKPYIIEGSNYNLNDDGIWLDNEFAKKNNYKVGKTIKINNKNLKIKGIILSAEEIYNPQLGDSIPDYKNNGYAYIPKKTFQAIYGGYATNEILVTYSDSANEKVITKKIQDIIGSKFKTYTLRDEQSSTNHINERIRQLTQFTYIFPILFFFLAVLTMLTTMTRLIDSQRIQIGTLMAIGYSKRKIRLHYLSYGLCMGLIGGILGIVIGYKVIPQILIKSFRQLAIVPYWDQPLTIGSFISVAIMIGCCVIAAFVSCNNKLKEMPALVLRGSSQKIGKHTLLEKIIFIWRKISLNSKFTARNISRNKVRSIMGIFGVLGSMVLVLAGLGMRDSLDYTVNYTYDNLYKYNSKVEGSNKSKLINNLNISGKKQYIEEGNIEIRVDKNAKKYCVMFSAVDKGNLIQVKNASGDSVNISKVNGLVISDRFAEKLGVKEGSIVNWRFPGKDWSTVKIGKIVVSSMPKMVFISKNTWKNINQKFYPTSVLSNKSKNYLNSHLNKKSESISKITSKNRQVDSMQQVFHSTNSIIYVLLLTAILLVVVVLSSLGLLNYTEMEREYATLKVIGLYPIEIRILAFKENLILSFIGWLIGVPCGKIFVDIFMKILSNDTIVCLPHINMKSYIFASLLVAGGALVINLLLSIKIGKIDMVTSLKSNE